MLKERFKLIAAVHLFLVKDGKILLLRRFNTGYEDGNWSVPAGHLEGNEKATYGIVREAQEELGVAIRGEDLEFVHITHRKASEERVDFFFAADRWKGTPRIAEPNKCDDLKWFSLDELPLNVVPYVKEAIANYRNRIFFSEFGWN